MINWIVIVQVPCLVLNVFYIYSSIFIYYFWQPWDFLCLFRAASVTYGHSQSRGLIGATAASLHHSHSNVRSKLCLWPTTTAHGSARSLIHWVRPRIERASSWILVTFVSTEPRWELRRIITQLAFQEMLSDYSLSWTAEFIPVLILVLLAQLLLANLYCQKHPDLD